MKVLIMGGTLFLGRHLVEASLARGHEVTLFNRGRTNPDAFPAVETVRGDRDGNLVELHGREWDAAIDTSARIPRWVWTSADVLVGHYTFISSASVYAEPMVVGTDEAAPVMTLADESIEEVTDATYGALKVLCERALEAAFGGRSLIVRAGLIVGPYDPTGRFTYWVHRIARGGDVLAPEPRDQPVQFIHARDLADWIVDMVEAGRGGTFNATGPAEPLTMQRTLAAIRAMTDSDARFKWVDERFLVEAGVQVWSDLPLWLAPDTNPQLAGFLAMDVSKALAAGLRFRPLEQTIRETLERAQTTGEAGLAPEREAGLLAAWREHAAA